MTSHTITIGQYEKYENRSDYDCGFADALTNEATIEATIDSLPEPELVDEEIVKLKATIARLEVTLRRVTHDAIDLYGEGSTLAVDRRIQSELALTDAMLAARHVLDEAEGENRK